MSGKPRSNPASFGFLRAPPVPGCGSCGPPFWQGRPRPRHCVVDFDSLTPAAEKRTVCRSDYHKAQQQQALGFTGGGYVRRAPWGRGAFGGFGNLHYPAASGPLPRILGNPGYIPAANAWSWLSICFAAGPAAFLKPVAPVQSHPGSPVRGAGPPHCARYRGLPPARPGMPLAINSAEAPTLTGKATGQNPWPSRPHPTPHPSLICSQNGPVLPPIASWTSSDYNRLAHAAGQRSANPAHFKGAVGGGNAHIHPGTGSIN